MPIQPTDIHAATRLFRDPQKPPKISTANPASGSSHAIINRFLSVSPTMGIPENQRVLKPNQSQQHSPRQPFSLFARSTSIVRWLL